MLNTVAKFKFSIKNKIIFFVKCPRFNSDLDLDVFHSSKVFKRNMWMAYENRKVFHNSY